MSSRNLVAAVGLLAAVASPSAVFAQAIETAPVIAQKTSRVIVLPAELQPFQASALSARVSGFVEDLAVDRGASVRKGQTLATLAVPELAAQAAEAQTKVLLADARRAEAESHLATATTTLDRLNRAAATPGTVAGMDVVNADQRVAAARAALQTEEQAVAGAKAALNAVRALEHYRIIVAPFAGRITERLVHPGALVGPTTGPLLRIEQTTRLRLVLPVPEHSLGSIIVGRTLDFRVPAHPGRAFTARLARSSGSLDTKTRSMVIEADVDNSAGLLAPGMFPEVSWPIVREQAALLVPTTAVVTTTERTFVIRVVDGKAQWVSVKKGAVTGEQVEVAGGLALGDVVIKRGTDEIRDGSVIKK